MRHAPIRPVLLSILLGTCLLVACGEDAARSPASGGELVVERVQEDGMTVVRNVSGAAWGGPAHLVEELSIGVMEGDDNLMLGSPLYTWLTDEEIYVLDAADSSIRVFDRQGKFLRRFGRQGQGPGEFEYAGGLLVTADGRVLVPTQNRVVVYSAQGEHLDDWSTGSDLVSDIRETPQGLYAGVSFPPEDPAQAFGMRSGFQPIGPEGLTGEPRMIPDMDIEPTVHTVNLGGSSMSMPVPLAPPPWPVGGLSPVGDLVYGHGMERYRFYIERLDGETVAVERVVDPVPISAEERENARAMWVRSMQRRAPDFEWDGAEIPHAHAYYFEILVDHSNRAWVARNGEARRNEDCTEPHRWEPGGSYTPCFEPERILEVFSLEDGSYLGAVERPGNFPMLSPFMRDDYLVTATEDEIGTPVVKVFRIVRPDDRPET